VQVREGVYKIGATELKVARVAGNMVRMSINEDVIILNENGIVVEVSVEVPEEAESEEATDGEED